MGKNGLLMLGPFNCFYFVTVFILSTCDTASGVFFVMINTRCFLISNQVAKGLHAILSPMKMGPGDVTFQGQWGSACSYRQWGNPSYGGATIRDFPSGTPVPISYQLANAGPKFVKKSLTNCHREVCRIKFYQIATSDVLKSL